MSVAWWSLKFVGARGPTLIATTPSAPMPGSEQVDLTKVFGSPLASSTALAAMPAAINPATRFSLIGVVANRASSGVALISVDGKPARPYRVGSLIEENHKLKSVAARSAVLEPSAPAGREFTLELAPVAGTVSPGFAQPLAIPPPIAEPSSGAIRSLMPSR